MCHANIDVNPAENAKLLQQTASAPSNDLTAGRLLTLAQGLTEFRLPEGFGIPVASGQRFELATQVLNHNVVPQPGQPLRMRHRVEVDFVRDADRRGPPMRAVYPTSVSTMVSLEEGTAYFSVKSPEAEQVGAGCLPGKAAHEGKHTFVDEHGQSFTGHWIVPEGREERHTLVTKQLDLPFDTTIHAIAAHLHAHGTSLELRDLTEKKTVFRSEAKQFGDRVGVERLEPYVSAEGIPVYRDHEYELVSVYDNDSGGEVDAMAVMYILLADKTFRHQATVE
jgi:hypothetical protein